ncbi:MAG: hypothetical protein K5787_08145 [Lentisphaeria bacterium]|nr:hypothetical protein [Lentisphaeria bacterium]
MSFQLTYSRAGESHAESLKRKETRLVDELPYALSVAGMKGKATTIATISQGKDGRYEIAPSKGGNVSVNGAPLKEKTRIMSGDAIQTDTQIIRFYAVIPPARQSWQSKTLGGLARASLALLFALQLTLMLWLPRQLSDSRIWDGAAAKQKITRTMDETRQRIAKILKKEVEKQNPSTAKQVTKEIEKQTTGITKLLVSEIALDLEERSSYFRINETKLSRSQRKRMMEDLSKLNSLLDDIENGLEFPEIPSPDIDNAVKATIDKYTSK